MIPTGFMMTNPSHNAHPLSGGLYVHTPFCETKCGYCDFYSVPLKDRVTGPLVEQLINEIRLRVSQAPLRIRTVFVGGGTPTLIPPAELRALLSTIKQVLNGSPLDDFTVEANPDTVSDEVAELLAEAGVTRVSMGVQSFFQQELDALERLHTPADAAPAIERLRRVGIAQLNVDLIFGVQHQTMATWGESLRRAVGLGVDHIACYGLTYEPNTRLTAKLHAGSVSPIEESLEADMYAYTVEWLGQQGFHQYEISNFARPGCESQHNLIYWRNEPFIGTGPSAAGAYNGIRYKNIADINGYIQQMVTQQHAEAEREIITQDMLVIECVMMQLRLNDGLQAERFHRLTGLTLHECFGDAIVSLVEENLLSLTPVGIALTPQGRMVANHVIGELVSATAIAPKKNSNPVSLTILGQP